MKRVVAVLLILLFFAASPVHAIVDPRNTTNNPFGIHIIDEGDLNDAARLVNSTNGDWGYVTLVIREDQRDRDKWQAVFDRMRQLHLIPIVRIATRVEGANWKKPHVTDIDSWVSFLESLNWVVQNRYVAIFNEPNHGKEWGGSVFPEEYSRILKVFSTKLKNASSDFFILPAGLDASAPNALGTTMDAVLFLQKMVSAEPDVFTYIDGWNSHSYPNPGFSGSVFDRGRGTIGTYVWEQTLWPSLGITKNLPIFITETGWIHSEGRYGASSGLTSTEVGNNFLSAFQTIWDNPNIVAVTPFLLNYQDRPFDTFSWRLPDSDQFYPQYYQVQSIEKTTGDPVQKHAISFISSDIPEKLVTNSEYTLHVSIENKGQSLWSSDDQFRLEPLDENNDFDMWVGNIDETMPFHHSDVEIKVRTQGALGAHSLRFQMMRGDTAFGPEFVHNVEIIPPPNVLLRAQLWFKRKTQGDDFTFLVYENGELKKKVENVVIENGEGEIAELRDVVPDREYRFVLLKPFYLPQQIIAFLEEKDTRLTFPRFLPFDFNADGALTISDIPKALTNIRQNIQRLLP